MIIRIMSEGQYRLDDETASELSSLDEELGAAVESNDEAAFTRVLSGAVNLVRSAGSPVPPQTLEPSELILPPPDASIDEVRKLLAEDGIILG